MDSAALERHRIISQDKGDPRTAAFDLLRTQVLRDMRAGGYSNLVVTSPTPRCGKTTVAVNLALSMAQQMMPNVLLADFDLRRPCVSEYLGLRVERDLADLLSGDAHLDEVLVVTDPVGLTVLPNVQAYPNATEVLTSPAMQQLVAALEPDGTERINVFDLPPVLPTDDTLAFLPAVDCVLLVVADQTTRKPEIEDCLRLLSGVHVLGVVLNKAEDARRIYA